MDANQENPDLQSAPDALRPVKCVRKDSSTRPAEIFTCWNGHRICGECVESDLNSPHRCPCGKSWICRISTESHWDHWMLECENGRTVLSARRRLHSQVTRHDENPEYSASVVENVEENGNSPYGPLDFSLKDPDVPIEKKNSSEKGTSSHEPSGSSTELPFGAEIIDEGTAVCDVCTNASEENVKIYTCLNGHKICNNCRRQNGTGHRCVCKLSFKKSNGESKQTVPEISAMSEILSCIYEGEGCPFIMYMEMYEEHVNTCKYRPIICSLFSCDNNEVHIPEYLDHLKINHDLEEMGMDDDGTNFQFHINPDSEEIQISCLTYNGKEFLVHTLIKNDMMYVWATVLDFINNILEDYRISVEFRRPELNVTIVWPLKVHPPHVNVQEIMESCQYESMSTIMLKFFIIEVSNSPQVVPAAWIVEMSNNEEEAVG